MRRIWIRHRRIGMVCPPFWPRSIRSGVGFINPLPCFENSRYCIVEDHDRYDCYDYDQEDAQNFHGWQLLSGPEATTPGSLSPFHCSASETPSVGSCPNVPNLQTRLPSVTVIVIDFREAYMVVATQAISRAAQRIIHNSLVKAKPKWDIVVQTKRSGYFRFSMFSEEQLNAWGQPPPWALTRNGQLTPQVNPDTVCDVPLTASLAVVQS